MMPLNHPSGGTLAVHSDGHRSANSTLTGRKAILTCVCRWFGVTINDEEVG